MQARKADGSLEPRHAHALRRRGTGRCTTSLAGLQLFPWTPTTAFALRRRQRDELRGCSTTSSRMNRAQTVARAGRDRSASTRASRGSTRSRRTPRGYAYYADIGNVPDVTDEQAQALQHDRCSGRRRSTALSAAGARRLAHGVPLDDRPRRGRPGILGPARMPSLRRDDYVTNSNDSYWLSNPAQPLDGLRRGSSATSARRARCARASACGSWPTSSRRRRSRAGCSRTRCSPTARWRAS